MTKSQLEATGQYQIYAVEEPDWSTPDVEDYTLEGCWGSEEAHFDNADDAREAADHLSRNYEDSIFAVADPDGDICYRTTAPEPDDEDDDEEADNG